MSDISSSSAALAPDQRKCLRSALTSWGYVPSFVKRQERRIASMRRLVNASYDSTTQHTLKFAPARSSSSSSPVEHAFERAEYRAVAYHSAAKRAALRISRALLHQRRMDAAIASLPANLQTILHLRYVQRLSWQAIASRLSLDLSTVKRLESRSLPLLFAALHASHSPLGSDAPQ